MGGVVFLVEGLVADHRPAGGLDHIHVQALLFVETHGLRHDDRCGAGDRDEADLEVLLFNRTGCGEHLRCGLQGEELRQRSQRGRGPKRLQEGAPSNILREYRAHHRRSDQVLVALLFALDRYALQLCSGVEFVRRLADMAAAGAAAAVQ